MLTQDQKTVTEHKEGAALVLAPAGSGKSTTILHRVQALKESGVRGSKILLTTFSKKSVEDLLARADKMGLDVQIKTLHSLGYAAFRSGMKDPNAVKKVSDFTGVKYSSRHYGLIKKNYDTVKDVLEKLQKNATPGEKREYKQDPKHMLQVISHCKRNLAYPAHKAQVLKLVDELTSMGKYFLDVYLEYEKAKVSQGSIDFDDMIALGIQAIDDSHRVYDYIVVDEAQDSNVMQYTLVNTIRKNDNIMLVGDDYQSIYGFTGAIPEVIFGQFNANFPNGTVYILRHNFRSAESIIEVSRKVAESMPNQYGKTILCGKPDLQGTVTTNWLHGTRLEAEYVVGQIERGVDTAILYRINSQSRSFEDFLLKGKIPYTIVGGVSFYQRKEVLNIVALCSILHNPRLDNKALARVVNISSPEYKHRTRFLGKAFLQKMLDIAPRFGSLYDAIINTNHPRNAQAGVDDLVSMIRRHGHKKTETLPEFISRVVNSIYLPCITSVGGDNEDAVQESVRFEAESMLQGVEEQLVEIANEYAGDDISLFFQYMENMRRAAEETKVLDIQNPDVVKLMTIHKSKGMEFDTVFVTGAHATSLPFKWQACTQDALNESPNTSNWSSIEEEQRLFYVAVTRPKTSLYVTGSSVTSRGWKAVQNPWVELEEQVV